MGTKILRNGSDKTFWDLCDLPAAGGMDSSVDQELILRENARLSRLWEAGARAEVAWLIASLRWRLLQCAPDAFADAADISVHDLATLEDPALSPRKALEKHAEPISGVVMHWDGLVRQTPESNGAAHHREVLEEGLERLLAKLTDHLRARTHAVLHRARLRNGAEFIDEQADLSSELLAAFSKDLKNGGVIVPIQTLLQLPLEGVRGWTHPAVHERMDAYVEDIRKLGMRKPHAMVRALLEYCHIRWDVPGLRSAGLPIELVNALLQNSAVKPAELDALRTIPSLPEAGLREVRACFEELETSPAPQGSITGSSSAVPPAREEKRLDVAALRLEVGVHEPHTVADAIRILAAEDEGGIAGLAERGGMATDILERLASGQAPVSLPVLEAFFKKLSVPLPALAESQYRLQRAETLAETVHEPPLVRVVLALLENEVLPQKLDETLADANFQQFLETLRRQASITIQEMKKFLPYSHCVVGGYLFRLMNGMSMAEAIQRELWLPGHPDWEEKRGQLSILTKPGPSKIHFVSTHIEELRQRRDLLACWRSGELKPETQESVDRRIDMHVRALVETLPGATSADIAKALALPPAERADDEEESPSSVTLGVFRKPAFPHRPRGKAARKVHGALVEKLVREAVEKQFVGGDLPAWFHKRKNFLRLCVSVVFRERGTGKEAMVAAAQEAKETLAVLIAEQGRRENGGTRDESEELNHLSPAVDDDLSPVDEVPESAE